MSRGKVNRNNKDEQLFLLPPRVSPLPNQKKRGTTTIATQKHQGSKKPKLLPIANQESGTTKQDAPRKTKDTKPKRPLSSYNYFVKERWGAIKAQNPGLSNSEIRSLVGKAWRDASPAEKQPFLDQNARDKERHAACEASQVTTIIVAPPKRPLPVYNYFVRERWGAVKAQNPDLSNSELRSLVGKAWREASSSEKQPFWDQNARDKERYAEWEASQVTAIVVAPPKRPLPVYNYFVRERWGDIKAQNPDLSNSELRSLVGKAWREASSAEKQPFLDQNARDKERHAAWEASQVTTIVVAPPKRPLPLYNYFVRERWGAIKAQNPDLSNSELRSLVGKAWREASPEEKQPFWDQNARDKERYAEWEASQVTTIVVAPPKRPLPVYNYFVRERWGAIKAQNPGLSNSELRSLVGKAWREASSAEKQRFLDLQARDKERYQQAMKEWVACKETEIVPHSHNNRSSDCLDGTGDDCHPPRACGSINSDTTSSTKDCHSKRNVSFPKPKGRYPNGRDGTNGLRKRQAVVRANRPTSDKDAPVPKNVVVPKSRAKKRKSSNPKSLGQEASRRMIRPRTQTGSDNASRYASKPPPRLTPLVEKNSHGTAMTATQHPRAKKPKVAPQKDPRQHQSGAPVNESSVRSGPEDQKIALFVPCGHCASCLLTTSCGTCLLCQNPHFYDKALVCVHRICTCPVPNQLHRPNGLSQDDECVASLSESDDESSLSDLDDDMHKKLAPADLARMIRAQNRFDSSDDDDD